MSIVCHVVCYCSNNFLPCRVCNLGISTRYLLEEMGNSENKTTTSEHNKNCDRVESGPNFCRMTFRHGFNTDFSSRKNIW